jgi:hypothetical protein
MVTDRGQRTRIFWSYTLGDDRTPWEWGENIDKIFGYDIINQKEAVHSKELFSPSSDGQ